VKTLYLLRHAKSDWSDPDLADHDRPLAPRGRKAARRMGPFVAQLRPLPALVLCSSAVRAQATWAAIAQALDQSIGLHLVPDLYGASATELLDRIRQLPDDCDAVLIVGHNPGLQDLAVRLTDDGDPTGMRQLLEKFPTAALATLSLEGSWRQAGPGTWYLESLVLPRDLDALRPPRGRVGGTTPTPRRRPPPR
jgi:phosphohistidine phosphatase